MLKSDILPEVYATNLRHSQKKYIIEHGKKFYNNCELTVGFEIVSAFEWNRDFRS